MLNVVLTRNLLFISRYEKRSLGRPETNLPKITHVRNSHVLRLYAPALGTGTTELNRTQSLYSTSGFTNSFR